MFVFKTPFETTYSNLPSIFFKEQFPTSVRQPELVLFNHDLYRELTGHSIEMSNEEIASFLSGNKISEGAKPIAQAYAGHQFGHFTMLGDGRAILLGEHLSPTHQRFDIQLKGAGTTPYSRRGDGRATLRSMLREYIVSEAIFHLGIPSSRSLAVVKTGEPVYRESTHQGAVLTRIMSSHIRVGTFEYARNFGTIDDLRALTAYTIHRHYPELEEWPHPALGLLETVMKKQLELVVNWMRVGFIHGVMNTDNTGLAGETYDYGPCAFMNGYHPGTVFSSIDRDGRYAFGNQPSIIHWNMYALANALLPLFDDDAQKAIQKGQTILDAFEKDFKHAYQKMMAHKIGFSSSSTEVNELVDQLLQIMQSENMDYTNTFRGLLEEQSLSTLRSVIPDWWRKREELLSSSNISNEKAKAEMQKVNPAFIPRNHVVEFVLDIAESGNLEPLQDLLNAVKTPYIPQLNHPSWNFSPENHDKEYVTFCGT